MGYDKARKINKRFQRKWSGWVPGKDVDLDIWQPCFMEDDERGGGGGYDPGFTRYADEGEFFKELTESRQQLVQQEQQQQLDANGGAVVGVGEKEDVLPLGTVCKCKLYFLHRD